MKYVNILKELEGLNISEMDEGKEDPNFWELLGCGEVPEHRRGQVKPAECLARLCQFYFEGHQFKFKEIVGFGQKDLTSGYAYLLDGGGSEVTPRC